MRKPGPLSAAELARNHLGGIVRQGDPEQITQARRNLAEALLTDYIRTARARAAAWPPFTDEQIARLTLLRGDEVREEAGQ